MKELRLLNGDCLDKLKELDNNSIDSIVTDPPYGLSFMGKKWDYDVPSVEIWQECLRVLKPGGHLLAFAGSRTYHRMAVRIEDAGFDIRDQIMWIYGSGFPKSHNIGKSIQKKSGDVKVIGKKKGAANKQDVYNSEWKSEYDNIQVDNDYEGWGTALKPAHEPIVMARKPIEGTVAENVLEWGTGGINIDGCRIGYSEDDSYNSIVAGVEEGKDSGIFKTYDGRKTPGHKKKIMVKNNEGRFPANIILECTCENPKVVSDKYDIRTYNDYKNTFKSYEENDKDKGEYEIKDVETTKVIHTDPNCPCYILDKQSGNKKSIKRSSKHNKGYNTDNSITGFTPPQTAYGDDNTYGDEGGASRFFYCPKTSAREREEGLVGLQTKANAHMATQNGTSGEASKGMERFKTQPKQNFHPTVKPTELMKYLIRLVTPKDGIVLDPFMGSGSTGKAAMQEGMWFVGIERETEYFEIAKQRIEYEADKRKFW